MTLGTLKIWRFIIPAVLVLLFTKLLGLITGWWITTLPDFSKAQYSPVVLVPAALYYITPFRQWINAPHHARIIEKLRSGLVKISKYPDRPDKYTWQNLKPLFFNLIDQDCQRRRESRPAERSKSRPVRRGSADMRRGPIGHHSPRPKLLT